MSKASSGMKLVKWLANQADDVVASADDLAEFGPQAARVRALLDFIPTMSDAASTAARNAAYNAVRDPARKVAKGDVLDAAYEVVYDAADQAARFPARNAAGDAAYNAAFNDARKVPWDAAKSAAWHAGGAESVSNLIDPNTYRILTNPLAAGRAVDILGSRPRNQGLPFYDVVRQMVERGAISNPRDVVVASRLVKSPKEILETALTLMSDGMSAEDAMRAARLL